MDDENDKALQLRFAAWKRLSRRMLRQISRTVGRGEYQKARRLERLLLRKRYFKAYCANRARVRLKALERKRAREQGRPFRVDNYPSRAEMLAIADEVDLWQPCEELADTVACPKSKGGAMRLFPPGPARRTRDEMISLLLKNRVELHPAQYAPTKGIRQLEADVTDALRSGEYSWAAVSDVVDCFGHIDVAALPELIRLPPRVVEVNVGFDHLNVDRRQERTARKEEDRYRTMEPDDDEREANRKRISRHSVSHIHTIHGHWGIPRGPSSSPIIAEMVIATCLPALPAGVKIFTWVDDILILAKTKAAAERAYEALRASFDASPAGSLVPRRPDFRRVADGFEYVGFKFWRRRGSVIVDPTSKNVRKLYDEMDRRLADIRLTGDGEESAREYLKGWFAAYPHWRLSNHLHEGWLRQVELALRQHKSFYKGKEAEEVARLDRSLRRLKWGYRGRTSRHARHATPLPYVPYWRSSLSS